MLSHMYTPYKNRIGRVRNPLAVRVYVSVSHLGPLSLDPPSSPVTSELWPTRVRARCRWLRTAGSVYRRLSKFLLPSILLSGYLCATFFVLSTPLHYQLSLVLPVGPPATSMCFSLSILVISALATEWCLKSHQGFNTYIPNCIPILFHY